MDYQLILSPNLDLTPEDFIAAWNEDAEARQFARIHAEPAPNQVYGEPFADVIWLILNPEGMGLGTNSFYDLLKRVVEKRNPAKQIAIKQENQPNGSHLLIIEQSEF